MRVDCGKCTSNQLIWIDAKVVPDDVQQGRLNSTEVNTYFYQICEDCGETVTMLSTNQIAEMLNTKELSKCAKCKRSNHSKTPYCDKCQSKERFRK